jgi:hypothetical protein
METDTTGNGEQRLSSKELREIAAKEGNKSQIAAEILGLKAAIERHNPVQVADAVIYLTENTDRTVVIAYLGSLLKYYRR